MSAPLCFESVASCDNMDNLPPLLEGSEWLEHDVLFAPQLLTGIRKLIHSRAVDWRVLRSQLDMSEILRGPRNLESNSSYAKRHTLIESRTKSSHLNHIIFHRFSALRHRYSHTPLPPSGPLILQSLRPCLSKFLATARLLVTEEVVVPT